MQNSTATRGFTGRAEKTKPTELSSPSQLAGDPGAWPNRKQNCTWLPCSMNYFQLVQMTFKVICPIFNVDSKQLLFSLLEQVMIAFRWYDRGTWQEFFPPSPPLHQNTNCTTHVVCVWAGRSIKCGLVLLICKPALTCTLRIADKWLLVCIRDMPGNTQF